MAKGWGRRPVEAECGKCNDTGVVLGGSRANPQELPCPGCNPDKQQGAWV